ncbi:hypothetical protein CBS147343_5804 [Aspergillus niger]|uniref:Uncharacterized protein n=1 Tax=Aspergillus niger TaxID=5061 RepID=A0A9W6E6I3_ASPNG|nr:hypothetical protein CBS133816_5957 [Aspergillus niger]KAI2864247.1 hypothetical protein CBS12448_3013 [Aspergillus niger]KAI2902510.1 hypothetical protein CBS13152_1456 [Aspergillus niger]KAI2913572.1 hypothetical protein CBS147371_6765 [Aspergillus niger]KAI2933135.1 hypothetical protein CBS147320_1654 [Aspergillus niger]
MRNGYRTFGLYSHGCLTGDKYRAKSHISVTEARTAPLANTGGFEQIKCGINLYRYVLIFSSSRGSADVIGRLGSWPFSFNLCRQLLANMASHTPGDTATTGQLGGKWRGRSVNDGFIENAYASVKLSDGRTREHKTLALTENY